MKTATRRTSHLATLLSLLALVACSQGPSAGPDAGAEGEPLGTAAVPATLVINEVDYDQAGTDAAEFVELKNTGDASVALAGYALHLWNGSGDPPSEYLTVDLPAVPLAAGAHFVICGDDQAVANCDLEAAPATNLIQNGGPDAITLTLDGAVVDALTYEGDMGEPYSEGEGVGLADPGDGDATGIGLSRRPDGQDTDDNAADFALCDTTPGAANACGDEDPGDAAIGACGATATLVSAIQGSGDASPLAGETVEIEGIVVGDFQAGDGDPFGTDLEGFFVQEEEGDQDGDPATSEGIFVHAPGRRDVGVGEVVRVRGVVTEFFDRTEIAEVEGLSEACGTAAATPTTVTLPMAAPGALERFEGMLVQFEQPLVIAEYFNYDRYGEIVLARPLEGRERPYQPTSYADPAEAAALLEELEANRITLDDGRDGQNQHPARHPDGEAFTAAHTFRGGDVVTNVVGILDYGFDLYRIQPTTGARYEATNPRPERPEAVGGEVRAVAFNVLNYFTTLGSRGADTAEEFTRQRDKIIAALAAIDADIAGLIEIENDGAAVADLVDGLNAAMGAGTYAAIDTGAIGPDEIKVAFIYKPATVTPVGPHAVLDTQAFMNPRDADTAKNRPALAQTFERSGSGARVTAVVNHFKSKGSACGDGDDDDVQGNCNLTRTLAARELLAWLAADPTGANDPDYLLLGDYNAYDEEDPIDVLKAGFDGVAGSDDDIVDLLEAHEGEFAYSYVFDGLFGHLDYALATPGLARQVTGTTAWHINADEPDLLDYDTTFKPEAQHALYEPTPYRSSDHDPIVVGMDLTAPAGPTCTDATASVTRLWPPNGRMVTASIAGVDAPTITVDAIRQDEPVHDPGAGRTGPDAVIGDGNAFEVRAEREGGGNGRVYHVAFTASDGGRACSGEVRIGVPASLGPNGTALDDGALHDATAP